jgi:hypothetical protein
MVFKAHFQQTVCAAKGLWPENQRKKTAESDLRKEIGFLHAMRHPNIVNLLGVVGVDSTNPVVVIELCEKTLEHRIMCGYTSEYAKRVRLTDVTKFKLAKQLASALEFLHVSFCGGLWESVFFSKLRIGKKGSDKPNRSFGIYYPTLQSTRELVQVCFLS